jgi:segregation and condensation protein B
MSELATKIEALLFAVGRPLSYRELTKHLSVSIEELREALEELGGHAGGIVVVDDGSMLELRATPAAAELIEEIRRDEYSREIGRAGIEALSAILYRGPLTRSEVDFIRGVNSTQTLRTLTMRGLIRKVPNPRDERSFLYEPTTELLSHLGVARVGDLPEYSAIREKLLHLEESYRAQVSQEQTS